MNFTETFQEFSSKVSPTDLALYAGAGLIIWVMFKDKLSPVQKIIVDVMNKVKSMIGSSKMPVVVDTTAPVSVPEDVFFKLVVSWKQTRDLAVQSGCSEAVKVADEMFPYLSPSVCANKEDKRV